MADSSVPRPGEEVREPQPQPVGPDDVEAAAAPWVLAGIAAAAAVEQAGGDEAVADADGPELQVEARPVEGNGEVGAAAAPPAAEPREEEPQLNPALAEAAYQAQERDRRFMALVIEPRGEEQQLGAAPAEAARPDEAAFAELNRHRRMMQRMAELVERREVAADAELGRRCRLGGCANQRPIGRVQPNARREDWIGAARAFRDLHEARMNNLPAERAGVEGVDAVPQGSPRLASGPGSDSSSGYHPANDGGASNRTYSIRSGIHDDDPTDGLVLGLSLSQSQSLGGSLSLGCNRHNVRTRAGIGRDPNQTQEQHSDEEN